MIDFHAHYLPRKWPNDQPFWPGIRENEQGYSYLIPGRSAYAIPRELFDVVERGQQLKERGIWQVLSVPPFAYTYESAKAGAGEICRWLNDSVAQVTQNHGHYLGFATLPLPDVQASINEVTRCLDLGLKGITLGTSVAGNNLDEPIFYPLWEKLLELDLPVLLNAHGGLGDQRLSRYGLANLLGNGFELATAGASLISGGILKRFKGLKFCLTLGGGSLPCAMGRLKKGMSVFNNGTKIEDDPMQYFQDLYFDTLTHSAEALGHLVSLTGEKRLVWGSDYPFAMGDWDLPFEQTVAARVGAESLQENAARLLGMDIQQ